MKKTIVFLTIYCMIIGCNEEPIVIPDFEIGNSNRVVLVEDLTGVQCPNCPKGSAVIENMIDLFGDQIAVISIHGRLQAEPLPESKYDFRTKIAEDLEEYHRPFLGKPSALINRVMFDNEFFKAVDLVDLWPSYVENELKNEPRINILNITNYNQENREISLEVSILAAETIEREVNLSIFITESNIVDVQETIGSILEDFEHNHVIRTMLTNFDGDPLGALNTSDPIIKNYTYIVPDQFNTDNMEIIIAVSDGGVKGGPIYQASKIKIKG